LNEIVEHIISTDSQGNKLNGGKTYKLRLAADIPASEFWSVIVFDTQTRKIICTDQPWPSVYSSCKKLVVNKSGSLYIFFGPETAKAVENNFIKTIPGKEWYLVLRLYGPKEAWFNESWKPGEIKEMK
jgi:hypothetical protein